MPNTYWALLCSKYVPGAGHAVMDRADPAQLLGAHSLPGRRSSRQAGKGEALGREKPAWRRTGESGREVAVAAKTRFPECLPVRFL